MRASIEEKKKRPARKKKEENSRADLGPTGDQDRKALCKRARSAPIHNTTKAAAEGDVVNGEQSIKKRQTSVSPSRKNNFARRFPEEGLRREFPWAGDKEPKSLEESRQISQDLTRLRNLKTKI